MLLSAGVSGSHYLCQRSFQIFKTGHSIQSHNLATDNVKNSSLKFSGYNKRFVLLFPAGENDGL